MKKYDFLKENVTIIKSYIDGDLFLYGKSQKYCLGVSCLHSEVDNNILEWFKELLNDADCEFKVVGNKDHIKFIESIFPKDFTFKKIDVFDDDKSIFSEIFY